NDSIIALPSGLLLMAPTASPSSLTLPYVPFSMKRISPPPHAMRVGFEPNQQGHAAEQLHASSSWPVIFQAVFGASAKTMPRAAPGRAQTATSVTMRDSRMTASFGPDYRVREPARTPA